MVYIKDMLVNIVKFFMHAKDSSEMCTSIMSSQN